MLFRSDSSDSTENDSDDKDAAATVAVVPKRNTDRRAEDLPAPVAHRRCHRAV